MRLNSPAFPIGLRALAAGPAPSMPLFGATAACASYGSTTPRRIA